MGSLLATNKEETEDYQLPAPGQGNPPGKASQLLSQRRALARRGLQEGDLVVVVASRIPEPYNLEQEQSGRLVKVDEEGDAYVSFFEDEDLWVHKSVLHLLAKAPESLPLARQVSQLGAATLWALCGLEAVLRLPAAVESTATLAIFLLLPLADLGQVRAKLFRFPELCASAGPALLMLSGLGAQEVLLAFSVLAFAWSAAEELSFSETFACRQRDGWALLCAMVLRMVLCMTSGLALASPLARITLGACGAAAAVWLSFTLPLEAALRQHRAASPVFQAAPWAPPQVVMMGLLTGSVLILFQLFLYSAEAPAQLCLRDPGVIMSLPTWLSLGLGVAACFASWDSQTEQIVLAVLPPCAVGLPLLRPGVAGAGFPAFCGLQLLALAFPKMLVVLGRHLARVSAKPWAGRCACTLFVAACAWGSTLILQASLFSKPEARAVLALFAALTWACLSGDEEEDIPRRPLYTQGGLVLLAVLACLMVAATYGRLQQEPLATVVQGDTLTITEYTVQGASKSAFCAASALRASGAHVAALAAEGTAALANQLKMNHYSGSPGVLQSQRAILSSVKMWNVSSSLLEEPCWHCGKGPTWVRASFKWQDKHVEFHSLTVDEAGNISAQIEHVAAWLRKTSHPLIMAGNFALPNNQFVRPRATVLRQLVQGTSMLDAFGLLDPDVRMPLPATYLPENRAEDYVFYRGLEVVHAHMASEPCSDHVPLVVTFKLPSGEFEMNS